MSGPETQAITGRATLTQIDNLSFLLPRMIKVLVLLELVQVGFCLFYYSASGIAPIWSDPGQAIYRTFRSGGWQMLQMPIIAASLMLLFGALPFIRLPAQNKILSYVVDQTGMTISDAAGASLQTPWSAVKRARRTRRHLVMKMQAGGERFAPWRAFSPADAEMLWDLVQLKTRNR